MSPDNEREILDRLERLEVAVQGARDSAQSARLVAEDVQREARETRKAAEDRLKALELWRARLEGAFASAKIAWALAGMGAGLVMALIANTSGVGS